MQKQGCKVSNRKASGMVWDFSKKETANEWILDEGFREDREV